MRKAAPLLAPLLLLGCAHTYFGDGPRFEPLEPTWKRVGILFPDITTYRFSGGGVKEYRADLSAATSRYLAQAIRGALQGEGIEAVYIEEQQKTAELKKLEKLLQYTTKTIQANLYGEHSFGLMLDSPDYSVGQIQPLCDSLQVDGILAVYGTEESFTDEFREYQQSQARARTTRSACLGACLGLTTGYFTYRVYSPAPERVFVCGILAGSRGFIRWYNHAITQREQNESGNAAARTIAEDLLQNFRRRK